MEKKIVLVYPTIATALIADLGYGEPTESCNRTSRYFDIAKGYGEKLGRTVKVSLIEEKMLLTHNEWGYALHVINDVDMTNCRLFQTASLEYTELEAIVATILDALENGNI